MAEASHRQSLIICLIRPPHCLLSENKQQIEAMVPTTYDALTKIPSSRKDNVVRLSSEEVTWNPNLSIHTRNDNLASLLTSLKVHKALPVLSSYASITGQHTSQTHVADWNIISSHPASPGVYQHNNDTNRSTAEES